MNPLEKAIIALEQLQRELAQETPAKRIEAFETLIGILDGFIRDEKEGAE